MIVLYIQYKCFFFFFEDFAQYAASYWVNKCLIEFLYFFLGNKSYADDRGVDVL